MFGHEIFTTIKNRQGQNDNNTAFSPTVYLSTEKLRRHMNISKNSLTHSVVNASKGVRSIIVLSHYEEATRMRLGSLLCTHFFNPSDSLQHVISALSIQSENDLMNLKLPAALDSAFSAKCRPRRQIKCCFCPPNTRGIRSATKISPKLRYDFIKEVSVRRLFYE